MEELRAVIEDARLTPAACRVVLYVAAQGEGWQEIPHSEFAAVLNHPSPSKLREALKLADAFEYLERKSGGRGHSDRYRVSPALSTTLNADRVASDDTLSEAGEDRVSRETTLKTGPEDRVARDDTLSADRVAPDATLRGDSRGVEVEEEKEVGGGGAARARLSDLARTILENHSEKLNGCREALADYLESRVPEDRQRPYLRTVLGWLDGIDPSLWRKPDGHPIDPDQQTTVLADALNDLAASNESDMKRPVGDPANLRTKVQVRIAQREDPHGRRSNGNGGSSGGSKRPGRRTRSGLSSHLGS